MINTNALRGVIVSRGLTGEKVARELGMTPKTFYTKMKNGVFGSDEMDKMIDLLDIDNPTEIFFCQRVTQ